MSTGDYAKAQWLPSPNFWPGGDGNQLIVVHATASGGPQTGYQLATSAEFTDGQSKSVHYINDVDGTVYQIVREADSAWGNGPAEVGSGYNPNYNWNRKTISIENVKHSHDNSEPLPAAQYQSLLALVRDIAQRQGIPLVHGSPTQKGIIFHHDLMPKEKAGCPGTFPYGTFFTDLQQGGGSQPVKLDSNGCVVTTRLWYQLSEGEQHTCGPTAVAALDNSVLPGTPLSASAETIDEETDDIILNVFGISDPKNFGGVLPIDMYHILIYIRDKYKRIHFKVVSSIDQIDRAVKAGYPCIISCNEMTEYAWDKNKQQWVHPYPWQLSGGHVFPVTGIEPGTGNWICPDQLNNSFQGYWPVVYDRSRIAPSFSWGCIVKLPFLADIPDLNNWPVNFNAQITTGGVTVGLPTGAKDDGTTIHFANSPLVIVKGYRTIYNQLAAANQIPPDDQPLVNEYGANPVEFSNPNFWGGPGTAQETRYFRFGWSPKAGSHRLYFGQEFRTYIDMLVAAQAERDDLKKQIAALQAQLAAATGGTAIPQVVRDDITQLASHVTPAASMLEKLVKDAGL